MPSFRLDRVGLEVTRDDRVVTKYNYVCNGCGEVYPATKATREARRAHVCNAKGAKPA